MLRRFLKFGTVGVIGFIVDAGVLTLLTPWLGALAARPFSFLSAVVTTFALNRRWTYAHAPQNTLLRQFSAFVAANLAGAALNLGTYTVLLTQHVTEHPLIALACGSLAGWVANFLLTDRVVFALRRSGKQHDAKRSDPDASSDPMQ